MLDMGIANEKDWGITLLTELINESGLNEDGSTWYRESGEDLGKNGYRCRWTRIWVVKTVMALQNGKKR